MLIDGVLYIVRFVHNCNRQCRKQRGPRRKSMNEERGENVLFHNKKRQLKIRIGHRKRGGMLIFINYHSSKYFQLFQIDFIIFFNIVKLSNYRMVNYKKKKLFRRLFYSCLSPF